MAIVLFGTPEFAVPTFERLYREKEDIALVVTQPDKRAGRGHRLKPPPVKVWAIERGLRLMQPESIKQENFIEVLRTLSPEFIVVVAYGKIIPSEILSITRCINLHASLLPKYRGAAPVQWALINGETETGVTTMLMDEGLDTGDILLQERIKIDYEDNALTLSEKLATLGACLMVETLKGLRNGTIKPRPQTGPSSYAPVIKKSDGLLQWHLPAERLRNMIRALIPWPCAYTYFQNKMIKILKADTVPGEAPHGIIARRTKDELLIGTGHNLLRPLIVQPEGRRQMSIREFLQGAGRNIKEGDRIG